MDDSEEQMWLSQIPKPQASRLRAKTISSVMDRLLVEKGYAAQQSNQMLEEQWRIAVGEELFSQSRVGKVQRGVLTVFASNTIVLSELEYTKSRAVRHLKTTLPQFKIRDIRFRIST